jgi:hypothetical protein
MYTYRRTAAARSPQPELTALLEKAIEVHSQQQRWIDRFPAILRESRKESLDLPEGLVWQDLFVPYWRELYAWENELSELSYQAEGLEYPKGSANSALRRTIENALSRHSTPDKAKTEYATAKIHFEFSTKLNRKDHIAYEVQRLETWAMAFEAWTHEAKRTLVASMKFTR